MDFFVESGVLGGDCSCRVVPVTVAAEKTEIQHTAQNARRYFRGERKIMRSA
jgi:hypothetical protein